MKGRPVTIRMLDPPLHEFLPHDDKGQAGAGRARWASRPRVIAERVKALHEFNPMLGFRGCRLGIVYPEITAMQARAIFEAACNVQKAGIKVEPEVMIPLVGFLPELKAQAKIVRETAEEGVRREGRDGRVPGRHDDRAAAGLRRRRPDRQGSRSSSASAPTT